MSTTTWNSDLLSNGSIFSTTSLQRRERHRSEYQHEDAGVEPARALRRPFAPLEERRRSAAAKQPHRARRRASLAVRGADAGLRSSLSASQGVTMNAIASEMSMPMLALIGIGLMYGPIRPLTNAIGSSAAITVKRGEYGRAADFVHRHRESAPRAALRVRARGAGGCSRPPRWRRRPGCRWKKSARTAIRG